MKPIVGEVVSTNPVSLADAASILSDFISKGTGATRETAAYLARTSAAFEELVEYHRHVEQRSGGSRREDEIKEEERDTKKHRLKELKEESFEGQHLVRELKTALQAERSESNGHRDATHDRQGMDDEKGHKKKRKRHREHEVDWGTLPPARLNLDGMQLANGAEDNAKPEDPQNSSEARVEREGINAEKSHKKKRKKHREHGVNWGTQVAPAQLKLDAMHLATGAEVNAKSEDPQQSDHRKKKKKRDRHKEGSASKKGLSDGDIDQPPKKKKKLKIVEYEAEVEGDVQRY